MFSWGLISTPEPFKYCHQVQQCWFLNILYIHSEVWLTFFFIHFTSSIIQNSKSTQYYKNTMLLLQNIWTFGLAAEKSSGFQLLNLAVFILKRGKAFLNLNHSKLSRLAKSICRRFLSMMKTTASPTHYHHSTNVIPLKVSNTNINIVFHTYNFKVAWKCASLSLQTPSTMEKSTPQMADLKSGLSSQIKSRSTVSYTYFLNHMISSGSEMPKSLIFFTMSALFLTATS